MLGTFKGLVQLNNRLERSWHVYDLESDQVDVKEGWHIVEFSVARVINHLPRIVVEQDTGDTFDRYLEGFHVGNNRMLVHLPAGKLLAYSESMQISRLAHISTLEGRARISLICFRYLYDFPSLRVLMIMIGMIFQKPQELSSNILQFYVSKSGYLTAIEGYQWWHAWAPALRWWYRKLNVLVVVKDSKQRGALQRLTFPPDQIILADSPESERSAALDSADFVTYLAPSEQFRETSFLLLKRAILKAAKTSTTKSAPSMVYWDHDYEFDDAHQGQPREPVFKPQPSRCYLYCYDYVQFACGFSRDVIEQQGFSVLTDESKRYYTSLELFADTANILHVDEVLVKSSRTDDAFTPVPTDNESPWPGIEWQRRGVANALLGMPLASEPSIELVIPTRDGLNVLQPCISSILERTDYKNYSITIVDNGSEKAETLAYFETLGQYQQVKIVDYPGEFNYSAINNFAVEQSNAEYVGLVNNDIEVIEGDWLTHLMAWATQPSVGIVGAKLLFGNGLVQHAGVTIGMGNAAGHIHRLEPRDSTGYQYRCAATQNMMAVTAACLVTPRAVWNQVGGLDSEQFKVAYNDIDFCLRVESSGLDVIWTPEAELYHHESVSRGDDLSEKHIARYFRELGVFQKRWKSKGFVDKYYSKHLRISDEGVYPQMPSNESDKLVYVGQTG